MPATIALILGLAIGPVAAPFLQDQSSGGAGLLMGLAAGWLALLAAESWRLETLRRASVLGRLGHLVGPPIVIAALALAPQAAAALWQNIRAVSFLAAPLMLLACAMLTLDPEAARDDLRRLHRPGPSARAAPGNASLALGAALAGSTLASANRAAASPFEPAPFWAAASHIGLTMLLGIALGVAFVGLLRLAEGRGLLIALLAALALTGWGAAAWLGLSPLAVLFAAGVVLANDGRRRDLVFDLLREMERPCVVAALVLAGARLALAAPALGSATMWLMGGILALARPLAWRVVPLRERELLTTLPLSPLAVVLALDAASWDQPRWSLAAALPAAVALAFIWGELTWIWLARRPAAATATVGGR